METKLPAELRHQFDRFTEQLVDEFQGRVAPEEVELRARAKLNQFQEARVLVFLPLLVYRYTREELATAA
jgi:hypothetical protein